jgi:hypothetical protein
LHLLRGLDRVFNFSFEARNHSTVAHRLPLGPFMTT